ncbi:MAG TPA: hypothetical protein VHA07_10865 [Devosia sp.]|nr:hypothetical protein [Devosia sp.]
MNLLTTLKAGGRAAAVAAAISMTALAAAPAQAAPPNFSFSLNFGNGYGGPGVYFNYGNTPKKLCLSDRQIYFQLQDYGFHRIKIVKSKGYNVVVIARYQGDWWQLVVNRCTGKIKKAPLDWDGPSFPNMPGFGITLSF